MNITPPTHPLQVVRVLQAAGHQAMLVGGCVRDALLGARPHDWDVATSASPDEVEALFPHTLAVGKHFGVIVVLGNAGEECEVATFRTDGLYIDGRRPTSVCFSNAEEDALRRDFTVNALFYDPMAGKVVDYVGGRADLQARVLRAVGEPRKRFEEDHLRLLRLARFAARLGFAIEPETEKAAKEMAAAVVTVSPERVATELGRMFAAPGAERALRLLTALGLLGAEGVLPEVAAMRGVAQPPEFHPEGDVFEHTALMLRLWGERLRDGHAACPARLREWWDKAGEFERTAMGWGVVLHDVGKPLTRSWDEQARRLRFNEHDVKGAEMAEAIMGRLKQSTRMTATVHDLVIRHMHFISLPQMREAKRRRFLRDPLFPLHLELHYLDCAGSNGNLDSYRYALGAWEKEMSRPAPSPRLLSGRELMAMGYTPGPRFREILAAVEDAALEGVVATPEAAMAWAREKFPVTNY